MTPQAAHQTMLIKRLIRLSLYLQYRADGRGNDLSDSEVRMVRTCLLATRNEWLEVLS